MPRKTLQVQVELDIQAVTCPGVWLCPNGKVSLQVYVLDSCIQTTGLHPVFPLLYHETFIFYKTFYTAYSLGDLQKLINKEFLYAELIQWQDCENGNVLATFQTSLNEVLYPSPYEGAIAGVDVDLLMEPSKSFPGIIAPKIEISTRTTVEEVVCSSSHKKCNSFVVNPKTVTSDQFPFGAKRSHLAHQRKVCHSFGYHKARRCSRAKKYGKPPFVFRRAEEDLLSRKPQGLESGSTEKCKCCLRSEGSSLVERKLDFTEEQPPSDKCYAKINSESLKRLSKPKKIRERCSYRDRHNKGRKKCLCGSGHTQENCPVCFKYHSYFEENQSHCTPPDKVSQGKGVVDKESYVRRVTTCSPTREYRRSSSRSPVRSFGKGKSLSHHSAIQPAHQCGCLSAAAPVDVLDDLKTSNSSPSSGCRQKCCCSPRRKPSLAEQIHRRLKETLDCALAYPFVERYEQRCSVDSPTGCSCSKFKSCREGFSKNLAKFYRDLRRC